MLTASKVGSVTLDAAKKPSHLGAQVCRAACDKFYLLTSVFVEYDERVEVGGKAS
jgi:hypothetical protein